MMLSDDYVKAIDWIFSNTKCDVIMTCLVGVGNKDREIYHYLHDHRKQIDRATGESVYFIYPVEGKLMSCSESPVFIRDKKASRFNDLDKSEKHLLLDRITDAIYDECPKIFPFDYYELPGLVFIGRNEFPRFVSIKSTDEIDLYIDAFGILDSFLRDYCGSSELKGEKQARFSNRGKQKEILDYYIIKLTHILLDEQESEYILWGLLDPYEKERMLFSLINLIEKRATTILNRIKTIEGKIESLGYDIFISCKSQDYNNAHRLHDYLLRNGHRPFIADIALREIGTDKYGEIIRQVIDRCTYMIVFATNIDYINTEYVRHEWNLFYDEVMAGRKNGRLYAVIPSLSLIPEMPIVFRNTQCFEIHSVEETILDFVKPIGE